MCLAVVVEILDSPCVDINFEFQANAELATVKQILLSEHGNAHDPSACVCTRFLSILEKHKKCMHMHYTRGIKSVHYDVIESLITWRNIGN